jgi:hypothetical protein
MVFLIIGIGLALLIALLATMRGKGKPEESGVEVPDDCCGAHEVCESETLLRSNDELEYYEDEELDRYRGMAENVYSDAQIEEFREILYTLKEREVAGWLKSLQLRQVIPPAIIREEALMIVADRRARLA